MARQISIAFHVDAVKRRAPAGPSWLEPLEDRRLLSVAAPVRIAPAPRDPVVTAAPTVVAPVLASIPDATINVGKTFTYQAIASGTPAPTYSLSKYPAGMTIDPTTGLITWMPTVSQTRTVTVVAANSAGRSSKSFTITVTNYVAPVIATPPMLTATAGAAFSYQMTATGAPAPTFALVSGPAGMSVSSSGLINWTPGAQGPQNVTISASNVAGSSSTAFGINVGPDVAAPTAPVLSAGTVTAVDSIPLSWYPATDNVGVVGYRIYKYTPAVYKGHSGRDGGYTLVSPAKYTLLVDGVTGTSYLMTGLATNTTYQYAVAAYDAAGNQSAYSNVVSAATLNPPSFTWSYYNVTNAPMTVVADHQITFYLNATGNPTPTLSMISAPAGVVFTPGQITNSQLTYVVPHVDWTPTADQLGLNYVTMQAVNSVGTYTYAIPITVTPDTPQVSVSLNGGITYGAGQYASGQSNYVVTANPGYGTATTPQYALSGTPFNFQVTSDSNAGAATFLLVSAPLGMTLDQNTGAGEWTPTKDQAGNTTVVIAATNTAGTSMLTLSFPTYFTTAPGMPIATYVQTASGVGTNNPTMSWTAPADTTGLAGYFVDVTDAHTNLTTRFDTHSTSTSYALSGLGAGQYFVTVTPYDGNGNVGQTSAANSIYAAALPALSWTPSTTTPTVGDPMTLQFGPAPGWYAFSLAAGTGASIDPTTGLFTWTPTASGTYTFVVAANSNGWGTIQAVLTFSV
jgi:hypothetical protein